MSEVEFLVQLLLNDQMPKDLHDKLLKRISEVHCVKNPQQYLTDKALLDPKNPLTEIYKMNICDHVYPQMWHGIFPPNCTKCGQQAWPLTTITCEVK